MQENKEQSTTKNIKETKHIKKSATLCYALLAVIDAVALTSIGLLFARQPHKTIELPHAISLIATVSFVPCTGLLAMTVAVFLLKHPKKLPVYNIAKASIIGTGVLALTIVFSTVLAVLVTGSLQS